MLMDLENSMLRDIAKDIEPTLDKKAKDKDADFVAKVLLFCKPEYISLKFIHDLRLMKTHQEEEEAEKKKKEMEARKKREKEEREKRQKEKKEKEKKVKHEKEKEKKRETEKKKAEKRRGKRQAQDESDSEGLGIQDDMHEDEDDRRLKAEQLKLNQEYSNYTIQKIKEVRGLDVYKSRKPTRSERKSSIPSSRSIPRCRISSCGKASCARKLRLQPRSPTKKRRPPRTLPQMRFPSTSSNILNPEPHGRRKLRGSLGTRSGLEQRREELPTMTKHTSQRQSSTLLISGRSVLTGGGEF